MTNIIVFTRRNTTSQQVVIKLIQREVIQHLVHKQPILQRVIQPIVQEVIQPQAQKHIAQPVPMVKIQQIVMELLAQKHIKLLQIIVH